MELKNIYNEILTEHNMYPNNKRDLEDFDIELRGVNPSCGDDITIKIKLDNGVVKDAGYIGLGCAISQASADMMIDLILDKDEASAIRLSNIFIGMIKGEVKADEVLEELGDAIALRDISHLPARTKCATLPWHTLTEMLGK